MHLGRSQDNPCGETTENHNPTPDGWFWKLTVAMAKNYPGGIQAPPLRQVAAFSLSIFVTRRLFFVPTRCANPLSNRDPSHVSLLPWIREDRPILAMLHCQVWWWLAEHSSGTHLTCNRQTQKHREILPVQLASHTAGRRRPTNPRIFHKADKQWSAWKQIHGLPLVANHTAPVRTSESSINTLFLHMRWS